jgi:hypothetical protein
MRRRAEADRKPGDALVNLFTVTKPGASKLSPMSGRIRSSDGSE